MFKFCYIIPFGSFYVILHFNIRTFCIYYCIYICIYNCFISLDNELKHDEIRRGTILLLLLLLLLFLLYITL